MQKNRSKYQNTFGKRLHKNILTLAAAGSGKTTRLVEQASDGGQARVLVTTYTNENLDQIRGLFVRLHGYVPRHIVLLSWYTFLLHDCVRPYQNAVVPRRSVRSIRFSDLPHFAARVPKSNPARYYLTPANEIYRDRVSDFACEANRLSNGLVIRRLELNYDEVFIDEVQDLVGWDLELLGILLRSRLRVTAVGDPRQAILRTNRGSKNRQYAGANIVKWFQQMEKAKSVAIAEQSICHRCNQEICDFADRLFPRLPKTQSQNGERTGHDGVFRVKRDEVKEYVKKYGPKILRLNKKSNTLNLEAQNIGASKGRTYDRVLIFPTQPMLQYLKKGDLSKAGDLSRLYIAVTRARFSVAFVVD